MVYQWKSGSRIRANAEEAAAVFDQLERSGGLTPARVVDASRPKNAPLHDEFEWNDKKAAAKWRENQAGHLIRCLTVRDETDMEVEQRPIRAYFAVSEPQEYTHITKIANNEDMKAKLLEQAIRELIAFKAKYSQLKELDKVIPAIDEFLQKRPQEQPSDRV